MAASGKQAISLASMVEPEIIILNAATMRTSGDRICSSLRDHADDDVPIILIRKENSNHHGESAADLVLRMPFTARKLMNRIQRFIDDQEGETIQAGVLKLNLKSLVLTSPNGEKRLTPKMAALLELFIRNANEVLTRNVLMQEVWETDYMGDTRTLDVHIRWLREAVEKNPSKPKYIITVRGVGYRLQITPRDKN